MKISYNWLKTIVNIDLPAERVADLLTSSGLEVEGIELYESIKGGLKGLVVGHVVECTKHPNADKLSLTKVNVGTGELLSIVCGAPNVAAGQKVVVAMVGAKLYPIVGEPFEIKKSKIRGEVSEGMICAEDEIGLGASHAGIMILPEGTKIGIPASDIFKPEVDHIFEIGLTPNRSDAASHLGVARDLVAILNYSENATHEIAIHGLQELSEATQLNQIEVIVENTEACPRYSGLVISGIRVTDSPDWLKHRLQAIGLRPINNIVDITNFVLHELGQPLHAFDIDKISGKKIIVKTANEGESFVTLDGVERKLKANDLMICSAGEPMCLAGIFGGLQSGVTKNTTAIFLESAYFNPGSIRKSGKQHGLKTDASFRFERGTDSEMTINALKRAANLILELAGGVLSMDVVDIYPKKIEPFKVSFSYHNCQELIGKEIDRTIIKKIILNLGIEIETEGGDGLLLKVPSYKSDVMREADVIEEVMRIYGYNNVEVSKNISYTAFNEVKNFDTLLENKVGSLLEGFGFHEIMGLSLSKESLYEASSDLVRVVNPLSSDLNVLRADMVYSGLEAIAYNVNRKNGDLKLFEVGRTYQLANSEAWKYTEQKQLSLFVSGNLFSENPYGLKQESSFAYLKGVVNNLFEKCGVSELKIVDSENPALEYGLSYLSGNKILAELGVVSKSFLKKMDVSQPVYYACFNWNILLKNFSKQKIQFEEISKYPVVRRDLALLIDKAIKYSQIEELAFNTETKFLKEVSLFDVYENEKLGNKKSYAVSFTLLNQEATLTDKQIDTVMQRLITNYQEKLGAELR